MKKKTSLLLMAAQTLAAMHVASAKAQYAWQEGEEAGRIDLGKDIQYSVEMQASVSNGKTPLWLNANKFGLSSLERTNGYLRGSVVRLIEADSAHRWALGYGLDMAAAVHYASPLVVQQAFVEARWLHGVLSVGAKEYPMELKNQRLSSGSQTLGINARPVPQVRIALPRYFTLPILHGWLQMKGHIAYGMMTDDRWQHSFTQRKSKYVDHLLYHSKAGYLRIGNEGLFCPFSLELGLEMACQFGGDAYVQEGDHLRKYATDGGLKGFWNALVPGGAESEEGDYGNIAGNQLGSWLVRVNWDADRWRASVYADHFFEDHSQMFLLDFDGYGEGSEWLQSKKHRFFRYALKDMMWGVEVNMKYGRWIRDIVVEGIYTKYQSGPYNHDHTVNVADHQAGMDDYYNHSIYTGWQHWGQVMGNPLFRSPLYNDDGKIEVKNNRFVAYHLGVDGRPADRWGYRLLATWQKGWGRYAAPFTKACQNVSFLVEGNCLIGKGWEVKAGYGMDFGDARMLGNNAGFQLSVVKRGVLGRNRDKGKL